MLERDQKSGFLEFIAKLEQSKKDLYPELSLSMELKDEFLNCFISLQYNVKYRVEKKLSKPPNLSQRLIIFSEKHNESFS